MLLDDDAGARITAKAARIQMAWDNGFKKLCEGLLQGVYDRWGPDAMAMCLIYWADRALTGHGWRQGMKCPPIHLISDESGADVPLSRYYHPGAGVPYGAWFGASWLQARAGGDQRRCEELLDDAQRGKRIGDAIVGVLDLNLRITPIGAETKGTDQ